MSTLIYLTVMLGLGPRTHAFATARVEDVGGRVKPGHDGQGRCRRGAF